MSVQDYIYASIAEYPSLYAAKTYEDSKLAILSHIFLSNGNGMDWRDGEPYYCEDKECTEETRKRAKKIIEEGWYSFYDGKDIHYGFKDDLEPLRLKSEDSYYRKEGLERLLQSPAGYITTEPEYNAFSKEGVEDMTDEWKAAANELLLFNINLIQDDRDLAKEEMYPYGARGTPEGAEATVTRHLVGLNILYNKLNGNPYVSKDYSFNPETGEELELKQGDLIWFKYTDPDRRGYGIIGKIYFNYSGKGDKQICFAPEGPVSGGGLPYESANLATPEEYLEVMGHEQPYRPTYNRCNITGLRAPEGFCMLSESKPDPELLDELKIEYFTIGGTLKETNTPQVDDMYFWRYADI